MLQTNNLAEVVIHTFSILCVLIIAQLWNVIFLVLLGLPQCRCSENIFACHRDSSKVFLTAVRDCQWCKPGIAHGTGIWLRLMLLASIRVAYCKPAKTQCGILCAVQRHVTKRVSIAHIAEQTTSILLNEEIFYHQLRVVEHKERLENYSNYDSFLITFKAFTGVFIHSVDARSVVFTRIEGAVVDINWAVPMVISIITWQ